MKKMIFVLLLSAPILLAAKMINAHEAATVNAIEGVNIFYQCKPTDAYEYLGTYKIPLISVDTKAEKNIATMVKEGKKKFPTAEAIVIADDMSQCDVVRFK